MIFVVFRQINSNYSSVHSILNGNESMRNYHDLILSIIIQISFHHSGTNLTHIVVLKPKQSGINNSTQAIVTYQKSEKNLNVQVKRK